MPKTIENRCKEKGIKMTEQRKVIARVIAKSNDHPDVEKVYERASKIDSKISIATAYRTVKLFSDEGIIEKHDFGDGKARFEEANEEHHDHIINIRTGEIIEFVNEEIEKLQKKVAEEHGFDLVDHRLELYVVPKDN